MKILIISDGVNASGLAWYLAHEHEVVFAGEEDSVFAGDALITRSFRPHMKGANLTILARHISASERQILTERTGKVMELGDVVSKVFTDLKLQPEGLLGEGYFSGGSIELVESVPVLTSQQKLDKEYPKRSHWWQLWRPKYA